MTFGPPPEYGDDLAPERPITRVRLSLREQIKAVLSEQPEPDLRSEIQAVLRELLAEPETRLKLQGPPGPPGQSVISGGGGGGLTIGGVPINSLAAGSNVTLTASGGQGTVAASGGESALTEITRQLSSAEIKALFSSPVSLVAGVAGSIYCPVSFSIYYDAGSTGYAHGGSFVLAGVNSDFAIRVASTGGFLDGTTDRIVHTAGTPSGQEVGDTVASLSGQPLKVFVDSENPTLGNGTITVTVTYLTLTV